MTAPAVTAVIVSYNSEATLDDSVAGLVDDPRVEVVVVDSGSTDRSAQRAASHVGVVTLPQRENVGWSAGCNIGAAAAAAPAIAFVNPDTRVTGDQLVSLASRLGGPVAAVSPRFVNQDGTDQYFYFKFPSPLTGPFLYLNSGQRIDAKLGRPVIRRHLYGERQPLAQVAHAGAACMVVDAAQFHRLGGFDERMWVFFSDVDLSRRLDQAGLRLLVDWDTSVEHLGGGSVGSLELGRLQAIIQRDYVCYSRVAFGRTGQLVTQLAVWVFSGLVPALMALSRGHPVEARRCIRRARSVLRK